MFPSKTLTILSAYQLMKGIWLVLNSHKVAHLLLISYGKTCPLGFLFASNIHQTPSRTILLTWCCPRGTISSCTVPKEQTHLAAPELCARHVAGLIGYATQCGETFTQSNKTVSWTNHDRRSGMAHHKKNIKNLRHIYYM